MNYKISSKLSFFFVLLLFNAINISFAEEQFNLSKSNEIIIPIPFDKNIFKPNTSVKKSKKKQSKKKQSKKKQSKKKQSKKKQSKKKQSKKKVPRSKAPHEDIRHKKYRVRNRTYYTYKNVEGFQQTGKSSWYGKMFHGRKTASGKIFNMNALTAAHRNLPMGTMVQVTNLKNGKKVILKINDRGPFYEDRILDVSKKAAAKLGFLKKGLAIIHLKVIK